MSPYIHPKVRRSRTQGFILNRTHQGWTANMEISGMISRISFTIVGLAAMVAAQIPDPVTSPNAVEEVIYNSATDPGDLLTTKKYFDGMGRQIRSVVPNGGTDIIGGTFYDAFGRVRGSVKPYSIYHGHGWKNGVDIKAEANSYYIGAPYRPSAGNRAYTENVYLDDPLQRVKIAGDPGYEFSIDRANGAGAKRSWFFALASPNCVANPTDASLDAKANEADAKYRLDVVRDGSGKFAQVIKDLYGHDVKKCSDPSSTATGDDIVTEYVYDVVGNTVKIRYPGTGGVVDATMAATFAYSATGQKLKETHPDEGTIESVYDAAGQLRFTRDEKQRQPSDLMSFTYSKFDSYGRITESGTVAMQQSEVLAYFNVDYAGLHDWPSPSNSNVTPLIRYYYDTNDGAAEFLKGDPSYFLGGNLKGKLVGQASCVQGFNSGGDVVIDSYSYDDEGRVAWNWKIIPGIPMQRYGYTYDLQGRLIEKSLTKGAIGSPAITGSQSYVFDSMGWLKWVRVLQPNGTFATLVTYSYSPTGVLVGKDFLKPGGEVASVDITQNIRGWTTGIDAYTASYAPIYNQTNMYTEAGGGSAPQYNGNISSMDFKYTLPGGVIKRYSPFFVYDGANRLLAGYDLNGPSYNYEGFQYDSKGRLVVKMENGVQYGPYTYASGTNRVTQVGGHPTRNVSNNFVYDPNGNMVLDRSKKMGVKYDFRNMPVLFRFYNSAPASGVTWEQAANLGGQRADVEIVYDAAGSRVIKKTVRY